MRVDTTAFMSEISRLAGSSVSDSFFATQFPIASPRTVADRHYDAISSESEPFQTLG